MITLNLFWTLPDFVTNKSISNRLAKAFLKRKHTKNTPSNSLFTVALLKKRVL